MKKAISILFFTLFLIGAIVFSFQKQKNEFLPPQEIAQQVPAAPENRCYEWSTPAGDRATLHLTIDEVTDLTGSFNWLPAEKDSKTGIFEGVRAEETAEDGLSTAELWWHTKAEGTTATEQLFVRFNDTKAEAGFGEMKDRGDGTFVYADLMAVSYVPVMEAVACPEE